MNTTLDYYAILELKFGADISEITSSYRRLSKKFHPDINHDPHAEETMKRINMAYAILCDDTMRKEYNAGFKKTGRWNIYNQYSPRANDMKRMELENARALAAVTSYFDALKNEDYETAYELTSSYDRQYVTYLSFRQWRRSVQKLFSIREYATRIGSTVSNISLENGQKLPSKKIVIDVEERNNLTQATVKYQVVKQAVCEAGKWKVFLGYRDLGEIAKMFEQLSREQEKSKMLEHWEQYCIETCRELDMYSLAGLVKAAAQELYRYKRYGQAITLACFHVAPKVNDGETAELAESAAAALIDALRDTDIPAYLGGGVFAVLFVELKKRYAAEITERVAASISRKVSQDIQADICTRAAYSVYSGGSVEGYVMRLQKKLAGK